MSATNAGRPVIVFGNCQAQLVVDALCADPAMAGARVLLDPMDPRTAARTLGPTDAEVRSCRIYFGQVNEVGFARAHMLPEDCVRVRFPALGSVALWPLYIHNPYAGTRLPGGAGFWYGDRVIADGVERDVPPDELLRHYLTAGETYLPDMRRVAALDDGYVRRKDAASDVGMGDVIRARLRTEPLFSSRDHPSIDLMQLLVERLAAAVAVHDPAFARIDAHAALRAQPKHAGFFDRGEVPIHPLVAAALGLEWYDANRRYRQADGRSYSYDEYFRELIAYCYANKRARELGPIVEEHPFVGKRPLTGATIRNDHVPGWYPDGFFGATVQMEVVATRPVSRLHISGYCPKYHAGEVRLSCAVGSGVPASVEVRPDGLFEVDYAVAIAPDEPARVTIASSSVFNMRALGEGADDRDLSVLVSAIQVE